jgi:hypothetical protein
MNSRRQVPHDQLLDVAKGFRFRADQRTDYAQDHQEQRE